MTYRTSRATRWLAITTLIAVLLTAWVPFYCATGWCCSRHAESEVMAVSSCCKEQAEHSAVKTQTEATCCNQPADDKQDNSRDAGCATGCCKLAATNFVLAPVLSISMFPLFTTLTPCLAQNTGTELSDHIPQPPRVLSA